MSTQDAIDHLAYLLLCYRSQTYHPCFCKARAIQRRILWIALPMCLGGILVASFVVKVPTFDLLMYTPLIISGIVGFSFLSGWVVRQPYPSDQQMREQAKKIIESLRKLEIEPAPLLLSLLAYQEPVASLKLILERFTTPILRRWSYLPELKRVFNHLNVKGAHVAHMTQSEHRLDAKTPLT